LEEQMIGKIGDKVLVAAAAAAIAACASAMFGGTAFAGDDHGWAGWGENNVGGASGNGGNGTTKCGVPVDVTAGAIGQGGDVSQCKASDGAAGAAGSATSY